MFDATELVEARNISPRKLKANRSNAQRSTGPTTQGGKARSRRNAIKHGILTSRLLIRSGDGAEDDQLFEQLLEGIYEYFEPVGMMESWLVEEIAACMWRSQRALVCEAAVTERSFMPDSQDISEVQRNYDRSMIRHHHAIPSGDDLTRILRYEAAMNRKLYSALNQLERLQRSRNGEQVAAPIAVQISADQ